MPSSSNNHNELYFSFDIEADGPIPGTDAYSMLSIGACICGFAEYHDKSKVNVEFHRLDAPTGMGDSCCFYHELTPISENFNKDALAVSGLNRDYLDHNGSHPRITMSQCSGWVRRNALEFKANPVYVAYPLSFDWMFTHWYFEKFLSGGDPFSFSQAIDMKTMFMTISKKSLKHSTKKYMDKSLLGTRKHTHNALDDAIGQGELFCNLFEKAMGI